jgi:hypothetical protein
MYVLHLFVDCQGCFCIRIGWRLGSRFSVVKRRVREKTVLGYEVYYKVDEGVEGREKSMGCMR